MKHIAIDFHIVKDQFAKKELCVVHVHTFYQLPDSLTKPLTRASFTSHHSKLGVLDRTPILRGHEMKEKNPSSQHIQQVDIQQEDLLPYCNSLYIFGIYSTEIHNP